MGYHRHHAIVVTSWQEESVRKAWAAAREAFDGVQAHVSEITPVAINGYASFLVDDPSYVGVRVADGRLWSEVEDSAVPGEEDAA